ncbi:hypothetical protein BZA70DRAFT_73157 [Myxozyma melibiosi]|uniref:Uncharacterized protein n=1 Tax=Myxozyma melibiosi TaxID=54550 RepID=A0ABR1F065_9ASCO
MATPVLVSGASAVIALTAAFLCTARSRSASSRSPDDVIALDLRRRNSLHSLPGRPLSASHSTTSAADPAVAEADNSSAGRLLTFSLRPQFRSHNKLIRVHAADGSLVYSFVRHVPSASGMRCAVLYSMLDCTHRPVSTIYIGGLKSHILFHGNASPADDDYDPLAVLTVRHVVGKTYSSRMFIMPNCVAYQWTSDYSLHRVHCPSQSSSSSPQPVAPPVDTQDPIAKAARVGTRTWQLSFDSNTDLDPAVIFSTALVSILDQWSTSLGVGGLFFKSDSNLTVRFKV